jgi:hypothetical protein
MTKQEIDDKVAQARTMEMTAWNRGDSRAANRYRDVIDWLLDKRLSLPDEERNA